MGKHEIRRSNKDYVWAQATGRQTGYMTPTERKRAKTPMCKITRTTFQRPYERQKVHINDLMVASEAVTGDVTPTNNAET